MIWYLMFGPYFFKSKLFSRKFALRLSRQWKKFDLVVQKLKDKHYLPKKITTTMLVGLVVSTFLCLGVVSAFVLVQKNADIRQQASACNDSSCCQFWCGGCGGFCGDDGVYGAGKTCDVQIEDRCGQKPCYVTNTCDTCDNPGGYRCVNTTRQQCTNDGVWNTIQTDSPDCGGGGAGIVQDPVGKVSYKSCQSPLGEIKHAGVKQDKSCGSGGCIKSKVLKYSCNNGKLSKTCVASQLCVGKCKAGQTTYANTSKCQQSCNGDCVSDSMGAKRCCVTLEKEKEEVKEEIGTGGEACKAVGTCVALKDDCCSNKSSYSGDCLRRNSAKPQICVVDNTPRENIAAGGDCSGNAKCAVGLICDTNIYRCIKDSEIKKSCLTPGSDCSANPNNCCQGYSCSREANFRCVETITLAGQRDDNSDSDGDSEIEIANDEEQPDNFQDLSQTISDVQQRVIDDVADRRNADVDTINLAETADQVTESLQETATTVVATINQVNEVVQENLSCPENYSSKTSVASIHAACGSFYIDKMLSNGDYCYYCQQNAGEPCSGSNPCKCLNGPDAGNFISAGETCAEKPVATAVEKITSFVKASREVSKIAEIVKINHECELGDAARCEDKRELTCKKTGFLGLGARKWKVTGACSIDVSLPTCDHGLECSGDYNEVRGWDSHCLSSGHTKEYYCCPQGDNFSDGKCDSFDEEANESANNNQEPIPQENQVRAKTLVSKAVDKTLEVIRKVPVLGRLISTTSITCHKPNKQYSFDSDDYYYYSGCIEETLTVNKDGGCPIGSYIEADDCDYVVQYLRDNKGDTGSRLEDETLLRTMARGKSKICYKPKKYLSYSCYSPSVIIISEEKACPFGYHDNIQDCRDAANYLNDNKNEDGGAEADDITQLKTLSSGKKICHRPVDVGIFPPSYSCSSEYPNTIDLVLENEDCPLGTYASVEECNKAKDSPEDGCYTDFSQYTEDKNKRCICDRDNGKDYSPFTSKEEAKETCGVREIEVKDEEVAKAKTDEVAIEETVTAASSFFTKSSNVCQEFISQDTCTENNCGWDEINKKCMPKCAKGLHCSEESSEAIGWSSYCYSIYAYAFNDVNDVFCCSLGSELIDNKCTQKDSFSDSGGVVTESINSDDGARFTLSATNEACFDLDGCMFENFEVSFNHKVLYFRDNAQNCHLTMVEYNQQEDESYFSDRSKCLDNEQAKSDQSLNSFEVVKAKTNIEKLFDYLNDVPVIGWLIPDKEEEPD
ncbi:MAG: hypothetical protein ABFQ62_03845 [Patescibacteria group bacterium]